LCCENGEERKLPTNAQQVENWDCFALSLFGLPFFAGWSGVDVYFTLRVLPKSSLFVLPNNNNRKSRFQQKFKFFFLQSSFYNFFQLFAAHRKSFRVSLLC